jgi:hypothetical protein
MRISSVGPARDAMTDPPDAEAVIVAVGIALGVLGAVRSTWSP